MNQELYALVGVLCVSEIMRYAAWGALVAAGVGGLAAGLIIGLLVPRGRRW